MWIKPLRLIQRIYVKQLDWGSAMYVKHALGKLRTQLVVVMAIAACLFFSPFVTKAYADGTFEITDWLSGYGYSSLQYIYRNNKAAMDAASTWSFSGSRVSIGAGSASSIQDFTVPTTVNNITSTYQSTYLGNGTRVQIYSGLNPRGSRIIFPAGFNGTVSNMLFEGEVIVEAGANVTFGNVTFYKGLDNRGTATVKNSTVVQIDLTTTNDGDLTIENTRFQNSNNTAGVVLPSNKITPAKVGEAYNEPITIPWAAATMGYDTFTVDTLPAGLTLSPMENDATARRSTATISGTPTAASNGYTRITIKNGTLYDFTIPMKMSVQKGTVAVPSATNSTYNGQQQSGFDATTNPQVVFSGQVSATHAGTYNVALNLADPANYTWEDGTVGTKNVTWTINKAQLVATYAGETVQKGVTPQLTLAVTGFVNGETADTALNYTAPTLSATDLSVGTHELTPTGGLADDYEFTYVSGTLTVTDSASNPSTSSSNNGTGNSTGGPQKKHKSHKKSVLPDTSDASVVLSSVSMLAAAGAIASGIRLRKRA